jgi:nucleoside phosphorylase
LPIIHTALPLEAKYLRKALGLKQIHSFRTIDIFSKENTLLVVSGVGKIPTSIALSYVGSQFPEFSNFWINIGIAGSCHRDRELGSSFLISKASDLSTNHSYYPDLIHQSPWQTATLASADRPWIGEPPQGYDLVDMEGSAFFQTALYFVESHQVHSVKIISDYLEGFRCRPTDIEKWMESATAPILEWIELLQVQDYKPEFLNRDEINEMESQLSFYSENLRLSYTQKEELRKALEIASRRNRLSQLLPEEYIYQTGESKNKDLGKLKLKKLLQYLYNV